MQTYETLFITTPTLTDEEESATVEVLSQVVTEGGGTFAANDRMGRRRLAYPIRKHIDGVYIRFLYDSEPEVPKELERRIRLSDNVLRSLTVRLEPNRAADAKEQAVRDAQARVEAAEREQKELEEKERLALEKPADESAPVADGSEPSGTAAPAAEAAEAAESTERES